VQILDKEPVDLSVLLMQVADNFQDHFRKKQVELILELDPIIIQADKDKLSQVFINLISNALKYTHSGGSVTIRTETSEHFTDVIIRDTGIGISTEELPFIFERFYRTDKSRTRDTGGSGIGLTIVKKIVDAHHGQILVESTPGVGSRFVIRIPKG